MNSLFEYDKTLRGAENVAFLCGADEAGRGPLAGDVFAAAVVFSSEMPDDVAEMLSGLNDSKKLGEKTRERLYGVITEHAAAYSIAAASVAEIGELNILNAALLAMRRAVERLNVKTELILIDGNKIPPFENGERAVSLIKGDGISASVAAASVLAKVSRDRYMREMSALYPQYEFDKHKGYGTKLHCELLKRYGMSPIHRELFCRKFV